MKIWHPYPKYIFKPKIFARAIQLFFSILLIGRGPLFSNWYSSRKRTRPFSFHAHREGRRAGVDSAACTATAEKRQRPDFDAPFFRLSALARVIRIQAAKKKGRKIDVDPAFPPEIRGVSDADLASTSAESPRLEDLACINSKKWDKGGRVTH